MDPRSKDSLLWGLVGALAFLVLLQAYQLATEEFVTPVVAVGVTVAVGVVTTLGTYVLRPQLAQR
jgi:hypothetical protein